MPHPSIDIPISLYFYKPLASSLAGLAAAMRVTPEHAARREKTLLELHCRRQHETRLQASDCKSNVPVFRFTSGGTAPHNFEDSYGPLEGLLHGCTDCGPIPSAV